MRKKKLVSGGMILILLVSAGLYLLMRRNNPLGDLPILSVSTGDASASAEFLNAQKAVIYFREEIKKHPAVVKNYVELAQLFLQEGRVTGRHHEYIPKAEYLLDQALSRDPEDYDANI